MGLALVTAALAAIGQQRNTHPEVLFGAHEFVAALEMRGLASDGVDSQSVTWSTVTDRPAESFSIRFDAERPHVVGADANGLMYGLLELAERVRMHGEAALHGAPIEAQPYLATRAINPFLTLPWNEETNEPDYDLAALTDPSRWYFHDDDYWRTLFDVMARSRLNWLDLHGTYDIHTTRFPNLYAYFVDSATYPEVGVPREIKQKNLAQLERVIAMAHARGVKVGLMSYEARFDVPHRREVPYEASEAALYTYTREVAEALIRGAPKLDALGFRIGESGHSADFFNCYLEGVERSGRDIPLYTRSWITRKARVLPLARRSSDFTVEIKYNGEHWGPPYIVAGGRVPGWYSYSFEDYLSDSGEAAAKRMWPGNNTLEGESWPAQPYKIVWQVRANGTHRIFPFYEPNWVRRSITCMRLGTASGFSVEPLNAYYPPSPRYYTARPEDVAFRWIHQRDEPYFMLWGRLGYDPSTPDEVLDRFAREHIGGDQALLDAWKAASRVIPTAFTAFSLGPDHRNHAPELEWGGDTESFLTTPPFDSHVFRSIQESLAYRATNGLDGRREHADAAALLRAQTDAAHRSKAATGHLAALEIGSSVGMRKHLGEYYANRLGSAFRMSVQPHASAEQDVLRDAASQFERARLAWSRLTNSADATFYKPFPDRLRMGTSRFAWASEQTGLDAEAARLPVRPWPNLVCVELPANDLPPAATQLSWTATSDHQLHCTLKHAFPPNWAFSSAWLLYKPLPSSTFFHKLPMRRELDGHVAQIPRATCGNLIAADIEVHLSGINSGNSIARFPNWTRDTPYLVVPARSGPTPIYYSSEEALAYLDPKSLDPAKHGMLLVCPRAGNFFWRFGVRDQRKLLDAVERGMTLVVMQQDFASGRYKLDWVPQPPRIDSAPTNVFDPADAFGLERVETDDILWQPIRPSDGWEVFGNGGVARQRFGAGQIVLVQARLQQRMHIPGAARNILKLLELNGREKPLVIVDAGSENATYATSVFPDFCNAHDIPFLTLGEVIAEEQGLVTEKIEGRVWPDRVLDGRGPQMVREFLLAKVREKANRPVPSTRAELEQRQKLDKQELMRSLGLDPLPPRTPLDARITGTLQRSGYKLEKLVFESRPGVVVTAHIYLPDPLPAAKCPVIVNPHGHWAHKKSEPVVQTRAIAQALAGYVAIVVDSPGHSFEGDTVIERRELGPHDDLRLVAAGMTATSVYVWDLMRALDYLETRPECDTTRVGITGASGGGLATVYAFAADERFDVAVPVVYATSLAVNPDNGCLCNHIPGTLQIGDRADVLGIRAPAPVLVIGARDDSEFPPEGTQRTGEKLAELWKLFDASDRVAWRVFDGPHDYSQPMRELALGFFDLHLRGRGDGSPRPEPAITPEPADSPELLCAVDSMRSTTTMRQLALDLLQTPGREDASWREIVAINGGMPRSAPIDLQVLAAGVPGGRPTIATFSSEPGLTIPALIYEPAGTPKLLLVLVSERGKLAAHDEFDVPALVAAGYTCCCIDARGCGELQGLDPRLMTYLGTSQAFAMGWDAACAAEELLKRDAYKSRAVVIGRGSFASQVAAYAGRFNPYGGGIAVDADSGPGDSSAGDGELPALQPRTVYGNKRIPRLACWQLGSPVAHGHAIDLRREAYKKELAELIPRRR